MNTPNAIPVGTPVIMKRGTYYEHWNGTIAVIVGSLMTRGAIRLNTMEHVELLAYLVRLADSSRVVATPEQVCRLSKPDEEKAAEDERELVVVR